MNKQELSAMVAEILQGMHIADEQCSPLQEPMVKGSEYKPTRPVRCDYPSSVTADAVTAPLTQGSLGRMEVAPGKEIVGDGFPVPGRRNAAPTGYDGKAFREGQDPPLQGQTGEGFGRIRRSASTSSDGDFVEDISAIDLRKLYLQEGAKDQQAFARLKLKTPARLASGRAGARYKTLSMLRFRADHAAAQDAVFAQVAEDFAKKNGLVEVKTRCTDKDEYLTRPDLGRCFDQENAAIIHSAIPQKPVVQVVVGDGLSSAACQANAMDCLAAIRDGLKLKGIELGQSLFVRYCRVGAGDAVGDITGCQVVCVLVGERQGLVTDKSLSAYITYAPHTGVLESARTVVSNIHAQGTPAVEAGAHIADLIETILKRKVSGVGLHLEAAQ